MHSFFVRELVAKVFESALRVRFQAGLGAAKEVVVEYYISEPQQRICMKSAATHRESAKISNIFVGNSLPDIQSSFGIPFVIFPILATLAV